MKMKYSEIQADVLTKYNVVLCDGASCYTRTHAHVDGTRRICKWKQANSVVSTFALLHEVGHLETYERWMRRAESEFYATQWAIERCKEYGIKIPTKTIKLYQDYIDREKDRGLRRGGKHYGTLILKY